MTENLLNALAITAIGMGLVFGVLALLWGVIGGLVYLLADREAGTPGVAPAPSAEASDVIARRRKQQAAVAAVAVALALTREVEAAHPPVRGTPISPWQNIMRGGRQVRERRGLR